MSDDAVRVSIMFPGDQLVRCIQAETPGLDVVAWATRHRDSQLEALPTVGAVLFRGFGVPDAATFEQLVKVFDEETLDYRYGSSPRTREAGNVFTSTEYPAAEKIPLHNEMSYTTAWPRKIWFYSQVVAAEGGETPLADSRRIYRRIPAVLREKFETLKIRYVRNFSSAFDVSWQKAFQTDSRAAVEDYCRSRGIGFGWVGADDLHTWEVCQASAPHPVTGEMAWMNQAHLFHISAHKPEIREYLEETFEPSRLPRNAFFGDGSTIPDADLDEIRNALDQEERKFPWQAGDVLLVDNVAMAHARSSFKGPRKVLVAMTDAYDTRR